MRKTSQRDSSFTRQIALGEDIMSSDSSQEDEEDDIRAMSLAE